MSKDDPVKPIPFEVAQPAPTATPETRTAGPADHRGTPRWVLPALGVLVLLALAVVLWLPASLEEPPGAPAEPVAPESGATSAPEPSAVAPAAPEPTRSDAAPWSDAQAARQRRSAQETAAELLDLQYSLEERGVEQWAPEPFADAKSRAAQGDTLYREAEYKAAEAQYRESLATMQAIEQSLPDELARLLTQAGDAIEAGDAEAAESSLAIASLMAPDDADIAALRSRADKLAELLPLLEQAAAAEAAGDLSAARQFLEQAAALDPGHLRAKSELARVTTAARERDFNAAMSEGYAALDEGRFDTARKAFRKAASLQEGSSEAASALAEVTAAETAGRLGALERQGRTHERQEQWQKAVATYERARKLDSSVLFASDGLARSKGRAELDSQLQKLIDEPQRLSDTSVASAAEELLARAAQAAPSGPRLQAQVSQLEELLRQYNTPVTVTLRSDSETEVIVYKVARLGRFEQRELTLRPGTYTVVGTRDGYRDVRRQFTIAYDSAPAPLSIACTEPI